MRVEKIFQVSGPLLWSRDWLKKLTSEEAVATRGRRRWVNRTVSRERCTSTAESYILN